HRTPSRMLPTHRKTALNHHRRHCLRVRMRRPRTVYQTFHTRILIAREPFVAGPSAHPKAPAHRRKRFLMFPNRNHKAHPFIHSTGLHPSHRQGPPCRTVELLPMSPVKTVTHVAGLDRVIPPPCGEGIGGLRPPS